jgi:hypothetical protein
MARRTGAGDEVIISIAGRVSRAMLSRYSHVRVEAKRRALDGIAANQRVADEKRLEEAEKQRLFERGAGQTAFSGTLQVRQFRKKRKNGGRFIGTPSSRRTENVI